MWLRFDPALVRHELSVLASHGCNVTRSFCFWPDFMPAPGTLACEQVDRFADFLDAHLELGMATIPTFIVGHMSGENWDPAWRDGRDLLRDVRLVSQQAWFAAEIARRFGRHEAVAGWLVSNEMPLYAGAATQEEVTAWARIIVQAIRSAGAGQPVSLGDGAWGIEVTGVDNGFSLRELAPLVDFVGPHVYPMEDDAVRQSLSAAFACELAGGFGKPVVLEEFGVSSDFASDDRAADYYRHVLYSSLLAGARGWLAWCNSDYDGLRGEDPYRHHAFELHFGLTDDAGRAKPQLGVLHTFSGLVRELAEDGWSRVGADAAIVVPEHFERELPFTSRAYREDIRGSLFQAYIAALEADVPVRLERERDGISAGARLFLAPSAKLLTAPGSDRLRELAEGGATVYLSYFAGSTPEQRGPWIAGLEESFGVRHRLRSGLVEPIEGDEAGFTFVEAFGGVAAGTRLTFRVAGTPSARSLLPVETTDARVVAVDDAGRPALLRAARGAGQAVLCTYPIEHMAARTPGANPESTWRIYSALATAAGVSRPVRVDDPRVLVGRLRSGAGERVVFLNLSAETVEVEPLASDGRRLGLPSLQFPIEAFGVVVTPREASPGAARARAPAVAAAEGGGAR
jgi:endo-1,4-beta-mannosidase